ncbi:hypothetical protein HOLleu_17714 [Holothuria leucospilota]|uniref:Uncharacterized protein n=1 Tax=Holothuria leucospilota TaxID=206669 RepID=A0A9Q1C2P8_HOLLE|nr:hypothetical protein HOLleu_17714 [Holothuria leucospilota]
MIVRGTARERSVLDRVKEGCIPLPWRSEGQAGYYWRCEGLFPLNPFARMGDEKKPRERFPKGGSVKCPAAEGVPVRGTAGNRPGIYDGNSSWEDYKPQFEVVSELHGWSPAVMAMCLAASLRGKRRRF